ncbi:MAG: hypothetical protein Q4D38_14795 [Planctomycetia bacterium]|nr:hypothetical protein [Planctomycetia bacterium]
MQLKVIKCQSVLIFGQCGHGKTTTVNRLLNVDWFTCAARTGTFLPHIKAYEQGENGLNEAVLSPYIKSRVDSTTLEEEGLFDLDTMILRQRITQEIAWNVDSVTSSSGRLANGVTQIRFVDMMGVGDEIITNQPYYEIYREFVKTATHILWITDASRRGYAEDEACLKYIADYMGDLERFTIGLNKADSIGLQRYENPNPVPTDHQQELLREKAKIVARVFQGFLPANITITEKNVVPFSAYYGWNFDALHKLFFE